MKRRQKTAERPTSYLTACLKCVLVMLWGVFSCGCQKTEIDSAPDQPESAIEFADLQALDDAKPAEPLLASAGEQPWVSEEQLPKDHWDIQYLDGKRVGYTHVSISKSNSLIVISRTVELRLQSGYNAVAYQDSLESFEYFNGQMAKFVERTTSGDSVSEITGQLLKDQLHLVSTNEGNAVQSSIAWQAGTWGVLGVQAILWQQPMQANQRRNAKVFLPRLNKIVSVELSAGQPEITSVAGGSTPELLPIDVLMLSEETGMRSKAWVDAAGDILKTTTFDSSKASSFRVAPEVGQRIADEFRFERLLANSATLVGPAPDASAKSAMYRVEGSGVDLFGIWSKNVRQQVKSLSALSAEVNVLDVTDRASTQEVTQDPPTDAYLQSSALIQADHSQIEKLAMEMVGGSTVPREMATKLTGGVSAKLHAHAPSSVLASALEVARRLEGDSSEYAVLLVALLRNRGIPARVALGIQCDPGGSQLRFHMWTEAWFEQRWWPLDAMHGRIADVDCLKMSDSALAGDNPYSEILPLLEKLPALTVQVVATVP